MESTQWLHGSYLLLWLLLLLLVVLQLVPPGRHGLGQCLRLGVHLLRGRNCTLLLLLRLRLLEGCCPVGWRRLRNLSKGQAPIRR